MTKPLTIAVIPGDGIGQEVIPEGMRVLEAAGARHGFDIHWTEFDWSCETYLATGRMMPEDGIEVLRDFDAIYLGAVGFPTVADHVSLWGLLIPIRREFEQYANVRPVRLFDGVPCPLRGYGPGDIDILAANFVLKPEHFDVVVASNLFGDILSDLGPACTGTIAIAPSANLNPDRLFPSMFEPVHGSAPDIAGRGVANPIGAIWAGAMMLEHLGASEAHRSIMNAIAVALREPAALTRDLGGTATTRQLGAVIADAI